MRPRHRRRTHRQSTQRDSRTWALPPVGTHSSVKASLKLLSSDTWYSEAASSMGCRRLLRTAQHIMVQGTTVHHSTPQRKHNQNRERITLDLISSDNGREYHRTIYRHQEWYYEGSPQEIFSPTTLRKYHQVFKGSESERVDVGVTVVLLLTYRYNKI